MNYQQNEKYSIELIFHPQFRTVIQVIYGLMPDCEISQNNFLSFKIF